MRGLFAVLALTLVSAMPPSGLVYHGNPQVAEVALTFDAGADRGYAARILDVLERTGVHASFGMTGRWAQTNPDLVRRMARDNDTFINHTYDHRSFTGLSSRAFPLSPAQRTWEITTTERTIFALTHRSTKPYFRPPYGDLDSAVVPLTRRLGYGTVVMWTVDSLGWEHLTSAAILQRCLSLVRPGGIVLMHVGIQSQDAFALPNLVHALRQRHYRLVTVPQLLTGR